MVRPAAVASPHALPARAGLAALGSAALLLLGGTVAGCGEQSGPSAVRLEIVAPPDAGLVREDSVEVRGRVEPPRARVLVSGRAATVVEGEFRALVALREGSNVIDVGAFARGASPSWKAVRVSRQTPVRVPDLTGLSREDALSQLETLGLRSTFEEKGGLLEELLPGELGVCSTRPRAGTELRAGDRVRVSVSKTC